MQKNLVSVFAVLLLSVSLVATDRAVIIAVSSFGKTTWPDLPVQARQLERQLEAQGFQTISKIDPDRRGLTELIQTIEDRSQTADRVAIFYLGLALSGRGTGYLLPAGTLIKSASDLDFEGVNVERFLAGLSDKKIPAALFVDGNRNLPSPWPSETKVGLVPSAGVPGTVIFTAGGEAEVFDDTTFLGSLRDNLDRPNIEINQLMMDVRKEVSQASGNKLVPVASTSLMADWFLNPKSTKKAFTGDVYRVAVSGPQEGMVVYVDDVKLGLTPLESFLPSGPHSLRVEGSAWEPWTTTLEGKKGDDVSVEAKPQANRYIKMLALTEEKNSLLSERNDLYSSTYFQRVASVILLAGSIVGYSWAASLTYLGYFTYPYGPDTKAKFGLVAAGYMGLGVVSSAGLWFTSPPFAHADQIEKRLKSIDLELNSLGVTP